MRITIALLLTMLLVLAVFSFACASHVPDATGPPGFEVASILHGVVVLDPTYGKGTVHQESVTIKDFDSFVSETIGVPTVIGQHLLVKIDKTAEANRTIYEEISAGVNITMAGDMGGAPLAYSKRMG